MAVATRMTTTTCSYCGVGCTLELHTVGNRIFKATSPVEAVVNRGNLCVKGRFGFDYVHHRDRLTQPLIRRGGKPGARRGTPDFGTLEPASWDEALDLIAARLGEITAAHGPDAIGGFSSAKCTNEENYLFQKWMRAGVGTHNVDHCSRLCHASSVTAVNMALGSLAMSNSIGELREEIDCLLITGSNTTENHPIIALEMKAAIARGAKLILIDPREIELAQFATYHLQQTSGTDVPIFNAMAHVIIAEGLWAKDFVDSRAEGFTELAAAVKDCTPEWAEGLSGVPADLIRDAARLYATSRASGIFWGMGISQHHNGTETALTLTNLALLCGQIGRPGTGINPLRGQNNVQGSGDMGCLPNLLPGYVPATDEAHLDRVGALWGTRLSRTPGLTSTELTEAMGEGKVHGLYIMGENPMLTDPNLNHARACFEELSFLAVQDIFLTETAEMADVVLPAAAFAEKEGTFTNTERRVQRVRKAVEAPGGARLDWQVLCDLSARMGYSMAYESPSQILAEIGRCVPDYQGITWERLEVGPGIQWPCTDVDDPGTVFLFADSFPRGRGKLHPIPYRPAAEPTDEEYPYILTTGRVLFHWHAGAISRRSEGLDAIAPEALVEMNPVDATRLGLVDAGPVRVCSRRGELTAKTQVTERTLPGSIFMTFHYAEAAANLLTIDSLDPHAKIPEFKVCAVRLEPGDRTR
jgi:formate dehydrogenase alpha subunit